MCVRISLSISISTYIYIYIYLYTHLSLSLIYIYVDYVHALFIWTCGTLQFQYSNVLDSNPLYISHQIWNSQDFPWFFNETSQVNALQCCCFLCLALAAVSFGFQWAWLLSSEVDDVRYGGDTHLYLYTCLCMYMYMHMCMYMYMHLYMCMVVTIKINIIVYLQFAMRCCIMPNNSMLSYIECPISEAVCNWDTWCNKQTYSPLRQLRRCKLRKCTDVIC